MQSIAAAALGRFGFRHDKSRVMPLSCAMLDNHLPGCFRDAWVQGKR